MARRGTASGHRLRAAANHESFHKNPWIRVEDPAIRVARSSLVIATRARASFGAATGEFSSMQGLATRSVLERKLAALPASLGFREGTTSVHTSRTMMLGELSLVLEHVGPKAKADEYLAAIVEQNVLGKPTQTTRKRTAKRLVELYALDQTRPCSGCCGTSGPPTPRPGPCWRIWPPPPVIRCLREIDAVRGGCPGRCRRDADADRRTPEREVSEAVPGHRPCSRHGPEPRIVLDPGRLPDRQGQQEADRARS